MDTAEVQNFDVHTTLNFFLPNKDGSPPEPAYLDRPESWERPRDTREVVIRDVTGSEANFSLDRHGFQWVTRPSQEKDFRDPDRIRDVYYKDIETLVKDVTGATRVHVFDHTIRRPKQKTRDGPAAQHPEQPEPKEVPPTFSVHVDQSYEAALSRVAFHLPVEAEHLMKGRVQILNIWRPIKTVTRDPLTVGPSGSFEEQDLVLLPVVYPHGKRTGGVMQVLYSDRQQWYYKHRQTPDEALIFKCFDNRAGAQSAKQFAARAKRVPHSAFAIPGTEDEPERESIEVRCLAFYEDDRDE